MPLQQAYVIEKSLHAAKMNNHPSTGESK